MIELIRVEDTLGEASNFLQVLYLAADGLPESRDTNALQAVIVEVENRLKDARGALEDLRRRPLANATIDLKALEKAVKAEIARRKSLKNKGEDANG